MVRILGSILLVGVAIGGIYFALARGETKVYRYESKNEVSKSGLVEKGWVPAILPDELTNFRLRYNLDVNHGCGHYAYRSEYLKPASGIVELKIGSHGIAENKERISKYCPEMSKLFDLEYTAPDLYRWEGFLFLIDQKRKLAVFTF